jgi:hypothetical protein
MKTFVKMSAAAVAVVGMMGVAAAGYADPFGPCPNGQCGLAGCPNGQCGPAGCPNGQCGLAAGYGRVGAVNPYATRTAAVGYVPATTPYYGGQVSTCPGGNCPRVPSTAYRPVPVAGCPNGRCGVAPVRYPAPQRPLLGFLGLNW